MIVERPAPNNAKPGSGSEPSLIQWSGILEHERLRSCAAHLDRVVVLDNTTSTQDALRKEAAPEERILVLASRQTAGRGRLGRQWADTGDQGVSMSFGLKLTMERQRYISLLAAVATADAIESALTTATSPPNPSGCERVRIRWPNDIMLTTGSAAHHTHALAKIAGILIERTASHTIIGIGINVRQRDEDWPDELRSAAISLRQAGCALSRLTVATLLMGSLCTWLDKTHDEIMRSYRTRDCLVGTVQTFLYDNTRFRGRVLAIDPTATLTVALESGTHVHLPAQATSLVHPMDVHPGE